MKLIVGLGNPGKKYLRTRHNVGFVVLDALHTALAQYQISDWQLSRSYNAEIAGATVRAEKVLLMKPMTYMNDSGQAVQLIGHYYRLAPRDIIVVHDDKDLVLGEIKVQSDRGHAGHNGVRSIIDHIGSQAFTRVRVGIAPTDSQKMEDVPDFVLGKFGLFERKTIEKSIVKATEEILARVASIDT